MFNGKGKNGQPISGTAAFLRNMKQMGGWEKVKTNIINTAATAAATAAVDKYIELSTQPPTSPGAGKNKPTRH